MFFVWGSRGESEYLCEVGPTDCSVCGEKRLFNLFLHYRVQHVWFLFRWVRKKVFVGECTVCGRAVEMNGKGIEPSLIRSAIPFLDRMGWAIGVGGIALLVLAGGVLHYYEQRNDDTYLAAPRVNDIYEVDLARMTDRPQGSVMWAAVRVSSVSPQGVEVQLPNIFYDGMRGMQRDVDRGLARRDSYYSPDKRLMTVAELRSLHNAGILVDVVR